MVKDPSAGSAVFDATDFFINAEASARAAAKFERIGDAGFSVFGGVFGVADNPALIMEGLGCDVCGENAALWMTYRWKDASKSSGSCEVQLDRLAYLDYYGEVPEQEEEDRKQAEFYQELSARRTGTSHNRHATTSQRWGTLTLYDTASEDDMVGERFSRNSIYVEGPFTYRINLCYGNAPETELQALSAAIRIWNVTQDLFSEPAVLLLNEVPEPAAEYCLARRPEPGHARRS
jgi:hypothetical protein